jgi:hypothetical protein
VKKGKRDHYSSFVGLERKTLRSEEWRRLTMRAKIFYIHLKAKFNGTNNGQIQLHFSELSDQPGFNSKRDFYGAAKELITAEWIERTNPGGLYRNPNTYRLTGKYDAMV